MLAENGQRALDKSRARRERVLVLERRRDAALAAVYADIRRIDGKRVVARLGQFELEIEPRIHRGHQAGAVVNDRVLAQQHQLARGRDAYLSQWCGAQGPFLHFWWRLRV